MANNNDRQPQPERKDERTVPLNQPRNAPSPTRPVPDSNPDYDSDLFKSDNTRGGKP